MKKLRRIQRRPPKDVSIQVKRSNDKCANCLNTLVILKNILQMQVH